MKIRGRLFRSEKSALVRCPRFAACPRSLLPFSCSQPHTLFSCDLHLILRRQDGNQSRHQRFWTHRPQRVARLAQRSQHRIRRGQRSHQPQTLAHLLKYDSILGNLPQSRFRAGADSITVDNKTFKVFAEKDPAQLPWESVGAQVVLESTGRFTDANDAKKHLRGPVKKVIISAPAKNEDVTLVLGVNDAGLRSRQAPHHFQRLLHHQLPGARSPRSSTTISRSSCGTMTTIHSYTNDQVILDFPHKDLRRARAAALIMIPTSTGAAKALKLVHPRTGGQARWFRHARPHAECFGRGPGAYVEKKTTKEEVNAALKKAVRDGPLKGYLGIRRERTGLRRLQGRPALLDRGRSHDPGRRRQLVKVISWYDNEWGYSCRVRDLINYLAARKDCKVQRRRRVGRRRPGGPACARQTARALRHLQRYC